MALGSKTRMGKRKIEQESIEKDKVKSKKVNPGSKSSKDASELEKAIKELENQKKQNEILIQEKQRHIEMILLLEETVKLLQTKGKEVIVNSCETQTEDVDIMRCDECDYPAQDICDLGAHVYEIHSSESYDDLISCHYCEVKLKTKDDLMKHRKEFHRERVSICRNFIDRKCYWADSCWYIHENPTVMFKCAFCDKEFHIKSELMNHIKRKHKSKVKKCYKSANRECKYDNCWYMHDDIENVVENENENQELFGKIFDMMEKFTQRIADIENNL